MDLLEIRDRAVHIAREAGELLRRGFTQVKDISYKTSDVDLVTQYDTAAESLIYSRLRDAYPGHAVFAEEMHASIDGTAAYVWHVDPLDGTNNFVHNFPVFAVSLALYELEQPLVAVVYDPMRDECFCAAQDQGSFLLTAGGETVDLAVTARTQLVDSLVATGFPYDRHNSRHDNLKEFAAFLKRAGGIRRAGAAALDLAYVAAGRLDAYWEFKLSSWDAAAGVLLVEEAGGVVTDISGSPFRIAPTVNVVASNSHLHPAMLQVLGETTKELDPLTQ